MMGLARFGRVAIVGAAVLAATLFGTSRLSASEGEKAVVRDYSLVRAAPAPRTQTQAEADVKSSGCVSCHTESDAHTMHRSPAVVLGCVDCHGGNPSVRAAAGLRQNTRDYFLLQSRAHVLPRYPASWHFPSSANQSR